MSAPLDPRDYPLFTGLCGTYLHPEWRLEDPDPYTAVDRFLQDVSPDTLTPLLHEIDRLLAQVKDSSEAHALDFLRSIECYYYPPGDGLTVATWLANLRAHLASQAPS